jgi:hypothetical protein
MVKDFSKIVSVLFLAKSCVEIILVDSGCSAAEGETTDWG